MLAYLQGKIINKIKASLVVLVNNVGYKVNVPTDILLSSEIGQQIELHIHHVIREDASDLYGFASVDDLEMFDLLLGVSGVGPKSALGVLSAVNVDDLKTAIACEDASSLIKVSGIGKKTAERVVLELKGKVNAIEIKSNKAGAAATNINSDEIDALVALGYSMNEAREALKRVDASVTDSRERIRLALRNT